MEEGLRRGTMVTIIHGRRMNESAAVVSVRMAAPDYCTVASVSLLCLDGRQAVYPVEHIKKD